MHGPLDLMGVTWLAADTEVVLIGALASMACALLGPFLVLRRMSMMGDAISHAVLPGLAIGFLLTHSRDAGPMLLGAGVVGVLTAVMVEWVQRVGKMDSGASMGVVFTVLFALGLVLIRIAADHVDLDPECVLYGAIVSAPLDRVSLAPFEAPRALLVVAPMFLVDLVFVLLFFKELRITSFDPGLATTLGMNASLMRYLLMGLVAATCVAAFESVGSILVIAMLIVPAAAAHLMTDKLSVMVGWSVGFAAVAAALGHYAAIALPAAIGAKGVGIPTAGMMGVAAGAMFVLAMIVGPRHGVISRAAFRALLSLRIVREDILADLFRAAEIRAAAGRVGAVATAEAIAWERQSRTPHSPLFRVAATWWLRGAGWVTRAARGAMTLTPRGRAEAAGLIRSHRLWETYLDAHIATPASHVHDSAERLEHVTPASLRERLAAEVEQAHRDPHGRDIPQ